MSNSSPSPAALPTPRQLLTSILTAISKIPPPQPTQPTTTIDGLGSIRLTTEPTNPLRQIPPIHRPLFTTLHVLFPSLLLPALDLLDRGLVTRLQLAHTHDHDGDTAMTTAPASAATAGTYLIRSAQKPITTGRRAAAAADRDAVGGGGGPRRYIVHTAPWNCTCAAFAFAAFPPPRDGFDGWDGVLEREGDGEEEEQRDEREFGGTSFDGIPLALGQGGGDGEVAKAGVPPCCKHLLACVLAERWAVGLGGYVRDRALSREEMAGLFADM